MRGPGPRRPGARFCACRKALLQYSGFGRKTVVAMATISVFADRKNQRFREQRGKSGGLSAPRALIFFFIGFSGVGRATYLPGWVCSFLFDNFSLLCCSFVTERTKGPAVSMRRPPTRGPQDPWTPRTITLCGRFFQFHPPRPTVDGPAHNVRLHIGTHRPSFKALITSRETLYPAPPPALPKSA